MQANLVEPKVVKKQVSGPLEVDMFKKVGISRIPFKSSLSFLPLIKDIEKRANCPDHGVALMAKMILEKIKEAPAFLEPVEDFKQLEKHKEILELLLLAIFPAATRESQLSKAIAPFDLNPFFSTPAMQRLLAENKVQFILNKPANIIYYATVINACSMILNKFYNQNIAIAPPLSSVSIQKEGSPIEQYFKTQMDTQYVHIKKRKPLKPLSQERINHLLSNIYDIDLWLEHIPPENFEFQGFMIGHMVDITEEGALSRLKYRLLEKDAVVDPNNIEKLQHFLRSYFRLPELRLGLTAIDYPLENACAHKYKIRFDFLAKKQDILLAKENDNSIYDKACKYKEVLLVEDLKEVSNKTPIERDLIAEGICSIIVAPLINKDGQVIGLLEIGSPNPYELHSFAELKFKEIISLFSMAIERSREEIDNRIEAIIREQFTAVHPSVGWKFIESAYNLLVEREKDRQHAIVEPIVFNDIYPLYGQADIVSSSAKRNSAIRADLIDNLVRAKKVLEKAIKSIRFPLLNQFLMKIERGISDLNKEFNSNDESRIVELLHDEIHPLLYQLRSKYPELAGAISSYFNYLDPELGVVYRKRKAYEDSVAIVNNTISGYLEQEERESQKILPHYFEKYKTDGIEFNLYLGQSLLNKDQFSLMHLKNFRLLQMIQMCEITRKVKELQDSLPVPLTTAQLIFAYSNPLSIRFRMDEKRFDVDGAYNVRYEILKKRIDKAVIDGTDERLTQAGKVAIVYLQEKDRQEYLEYIDYLLHEGYITEEIEDVKLGKLQGVQGLRALRVTVTQN